MNQSPDKSEEFAVWKMLLPVSNQNFIFKEYNCISLIHRQTGQSTESIGEVQTPYIPEPIKLSITKS